MTNVNVPLDDFWSSVLLPGWLQSRHCVFSVWRDGQFLLAACRGPLSSCTTGRFFLLWEEILLGLHYDRLGWEKNFFLHSATYCLQEKKEKWNHIFDSVFSECILSVVSPGGPAIIITAWSIGKAYYNDVGWEKQQETVNPYLGLIFHIFSIVSWLTRCWDIIETTDVFWWIIKTPILASILVSLQPAFFVWSLISVQFKPSALMLCWCFYHC